MHLKCMSILNLSSKHSKYDVVQKGHFQAMESLARGIKPGFSLIMNGMMVLSVCLKCKVWFSHFSHIHTSPNVFDFAFVLLHRKHFVFLWFWINKGNDRFGQDTKGRKLNFKSFMIWA